MLWITHLTYPKIRANRGLRHDAQKLIKDSTLGLLLIRNFRMKTVFMLCTQQAPGNRVFLTRTTAFTPHYCGPPWG